MLPNTHLRSCRFAGADQRVPRSRRHRERGAAAADPFEISRLPATRTSGGKSGLDDAWIETERLVLRIHRSDDFPAYFQMLSDPDGFRFSTFQPMSRDEAWNRLLWNIGHWSLLGYGLFAVIEKASGRLVGEVGLGEFRRLLGAQFDPYPEASWIITGWAQGQGYATEAAAATLDWMEIKFAANRTVCLVNSDDCESLTLARKLGYLPFAKRAYRGHAAVLHERVTPATQASPGIHGRGGSHLASRVFP